MCLRWRCKWLLYIYSTAVNGTPPRPAKTPCANSSFAGHSIQFKSSKSSAYCAALAVCAVRELRGATTLNAVGDATRVRYVTYELCAHIHARETTASEIGSHVAHDNATRVHPYTSSRLTHEYPCSTFKWVQMTRNVALLT